MLLNQFVVRALRPFRFRGKYRLLNFVAPKDGIVSTVVFDSRFELDLSELIQRHIYFGSYEQQETVLILDYLKAGMTVFDGGANVGYYTALSAKCVGTAGRVFAFEPSPLMFAALSKMVSGNHLTQVRCVKLGLSDRSGEERLYYFPPSGPVKNHNPTMIRHGDGPPLAVVPTITIDEFMDREKVEQIDLLKLDVEGWELRVLEGAKNAMREGRIKAVLCEFNEPWLTDVGSSGGALSKLLCDFRFKLHSGSSPENYFYLL